MDRLGCVVILLLFLGFAGLNLCTLASVDIENKMHNTTKNGTDGLAVDAPGRSTNVTEHESKPSSLPGPPSAPLSTTVNDSGPHPGLRSPELPNASKEPNRTKSSDPSMIDHNSPPLVPPSPNSENGTTPKPQNGFKKHDGQKAPIGNVPPASPSTVHGNRTHDDGKTPTYSGVPKEKPHKERCNTTITCTDKKNLSACLYVAQDGSTELLLVIRNDGEDELDVNVTAAGSSFKEVRLKKHQKQKIKLPASDSEVTKIILNAGNGECVLQRKQSSSNIFQDLPAYTSLVTPMYGAYFLAFTVLTIGGTCLCCKFRRQQQRHGGARYQELEMSLPETDFPASTTSGKPEADPADGWDRSWDDGWEDEESGKPNRPVNGHTSRATDKDGWEDNWDD